MLKFNACCRINDTTTGVFYAARWVDFMMSQNNIYRPILNCIDRQETKRYAGLRKGGDFPEKLVDEACGIVMMLKEPQTAWAVYSYDSAAGCVKTSENYYVPGQSLLKHLAQASQVVFLTATIGEMVEEAASSAFARGEYALGMLIDAAATAAVEQTADELEKLLKNKYQAQGFRMTFRFSPGYGDWDLNEQGRVAVLAKAASIGVTLTDSLMLMPRKSITAVIGLCPDINEETPSKGCNKCSKLDCSMRRDG